MLSCAVRTLCKLPMKKECGCRILGQPGHSGIVLKIRGHGIPEVSLNLPPLNPIAPEPYRSPKLNIGRTYKHLGAKRPKKSCFNKAVGAQDLKNNSPWSLKARDLKAESGFCSFRVQGSGFV